LFETIHKSKSFAKELCILLKLLGLSAHFRRGYTSIFEEIRGRKNNVTLFLFNIVKTHKKSSLFGDGRREQKFSVRICVLDEHSPSPLQP
jgi:hypothetical protein